MASMGSGDLGPRMVVLGLLTVFVFAPICLWPWVCSHVFHAAVLLAMAEWARGIAQSEALASLRRPGPGAGLAGTLVAGGKVAYAVIALLAWSLPTLAAVRSRIEGPCPGHRRSMEAIAVVLLVSDSAQLASGRAFGRTKALPWVSPNKSVEGYVGGFLATALYATGVHGWDARTVAAVYVAGVLGDLYFSLAKRVLGRKDFSGLLGVHGGVCDRIDSYVGAWAALSMLCP